jgi:hypothetical protein
MNIIKKLIHEYGSPLEWDSATKAALMMMVMTLIAHTQYIYGPIIRSQRPPL